MSEQDVQAFGTGILGTGAIAGWAFLVLYVALAPWWRSREGWYLMVSSLSFAAILSYNFAVIVGWLDGSERPWVRLAIYLTIMIVMLWRGVLLIQAVLERWHDRPKKRVL